LRSDQVCDGVHLHQLVGGRVPEHRGVGLVGEDHPAVLDNRDALERCLDDISQELLADPQALERSDFRGEVFNHTHQPDHLAVFSPQGRLADAERMPGAVGKGRLAEDFLGLAALQHLTVRFRG
jgi:hypothetical protein